MKKSNQLLIAFFVALVFVMLSLTVINYVHAQTPCVQIVCPNAKDANYPASAMWVWRKTDFAGVPSEKEKLLNYATDNKITTLYVDSYAYLNSNQSALVGLIESAAQRCINVQILIGDPTWSQTANHQKVLDLITKAKQVQSKLSDVARPSLTGIQTDIEPYTLGAMTQERSLEYYQLTVKMKDALKGSGLKLSMTIPFWYMQPDPKTDVKLTVGTTTKSLAAFVIDTADETILMSYRDTAKAIEDIGAQEVAYAKTLGGSNFNGPKKITFGMETICLPQASITFCEEGKAAMNAAAVQIMKDMPGVGIAKHHYHELLKWN